MRAKVSLASPPLHRGKIILSPPCFLFWQQKGFIFCQYAIKHFLKNFGFEKNFWSTEIKISAIKTQHFQSSKKSREIINLFLAVFSQGVAMSQEIFQPILKIFGINRFRRVWKSNECFPLFAALNDWNKIHCINATEWNFSFKCEAH